MSFIRKSVLLLALCIVASGSFAGSWEGTIAELMFVQKGEGDQNRSVVLISLTSTSEYNTKPTCNSTNRFALDTATESGKTMLAALMSAQAQHVNVKLYGRDINGLPNDDCTAWGDSETLYWMAIAPQ